MVQVTVADNVNGTGIGGATPGSSSAPGGFLTGQWQQISLTTLGVTSLNPGEAGAVFKGANSQSQAINDWCDKEVDAINEPSRPIPSGKVPGSWGFWIAVIMSITGIIVSWFLGFWGFFATIIAISCAWAYSAEPLRLKRSGIIGPGIVALCYEGLPWFTGVAILTSQFPSINIILVAGFYAFGAFGIMVLNDFKAIEGDQKFGINSLPVTLGPRKAGLLSCFIMTLAQIAVISTFVQLKMYSIALVILILLCIQLVAMSKMLTNPKKLVPWYNATGVLLLSLIHI